MMILFKVQFSEIFPDDLVDSDLEQSQKKSDIIFLSIQSEN